LYWILISQLRDSTISTPELKINQKLTELCGRMAVYTLTETVLGVWFGFFSWE